MVEGGGLTKCSAHELMTFELIQWSELILFTWLSLYEFLVRMIIQKGEHHFDTMKTLC